MQLYGEAKFKSITFIICHKATEMRFWSLRKLPSAVFAAMPSVVAKTTKLFTHNISNILEAELGGGESLN